MSKFRFTRFVLTVTLASTSAAHAAYFIELVPDNPGTHGPLLYDPGESLAVDVIIHNESTVYRALRLIQWDTSASDPAIIFNGHFAFNLPNFGALYMVFGNYPLPAAVYTALTPIPDIIFIIGPQPGAALSGTMSITLPDEPGGYKLDVVNPGNTDPNQGAILNSGFGPDPPPDPSWCPFVGCDGGSLIIGGSLTLHVIPEPSTLIFLAFGALGLLRPWQSRGRRAGVGPALSPHLA
jgi:hypothetical protein